MGEETEVAAKMRCWENGMLASAKRSVLDAEDRHDQRNRLAAVDAFHVDPHNAGARGGPRYGHRSRYAQRGPRCKPARTDGQASAHTLQCSMPCWPCCSHSSPQSRQASAQACSDALTSRGSKAVWRERILPVASHTSAQSRLTLMQRESDLLRSSSPRQASAQAVQLWAHPPRLPEQT